QARRGSGDHGRGTQPQVEDVAGDLEVGGSGRHPAEQGPGVQEGGVVGVVLEGGQVQSGALGEFGQSHDLVGVVGRGGQEGTELQSVSVVGHEDPPIVLFTNDILHNSAVSAPIP